jgi:adenylyl-sulfate kinase
MSERILIPTPSKISREEREFYLKQRGIVLWFTGLSGSGKSTLARHLEDLLIREGRWTVVLDGDILRQGLNKDLGFSKEDRKENIRRLAEVAKILKDHQAIVITAFISPYREDREQARERIGPEEFVEIYTSAPLEVCEERDPKGLYKKARKGEIREFTGIDAPYEPPLHPEIVLDTSVLSEEECVKRILAYLHERKVFLG